MQQPANAYGQTPSNPPTTITTDQIQKYLDENKQLILAILDNQNLGKLAECAQYQAQLQKNLLFLAAIADNQPQAPAARQMMMPQAAMQQAGQSMPQAPSFPPRAPFNPQQMQQQQQQLHQQHQSPPFQGHMGMRPGVMNGMLPMHVATPPHGGSVGRPSSPSMGEFPRGGMTNSSIDARGSKQDRGSAESGPGNDVQMSSAANPGSGDSQSASVRRPEEGKTP